MYAFLSPVAPLCALATILKLLPFPLMSDQTVPEPLYEFVSVASRWTTKPLVGNTPPATSNLFQRFPVQTSILRKSVFQITVPIA